MRGEVLLDTSIVVALFNSDPAVKRALSKGPPTHINAIVVGELLFGASKSARRQENLRRTTDFVASIHVHDCKRTTAAIYGDLKLKLRAAGKPIPDNDLWIAATALEYGLTLVSRDKHFEHVPGLGVQAW